MANFKKFLPKLLKFEGGYVDDPDDPGGKTNKGITLKTFKKYAVLLLNISPTVANLKRLTDTQAGIIYKISFWDRIKGDKIRSQEVAEIIADHLINAGSVSIKMVQIIANKMGASLSVDKKFGALTLAAINKLNANDFHDNFKNARIIFYNALAKRRPKLKKFLKGWLNRVDKFVSSKKKGSNISLNSTTDISSIISVIRDQTNQINRRTKVTRTKLNELEKLLNDKT